MEDLYEGETKSEGDIAETESSNPIEKPTSEAKKYITKDMTEEEIDVYLHNENGKLDYGKVTELAEAILSGRVGLRRLSEGEEKGRSGLVEVVSALLRGRSNSNAEAKCLGS